MRQIVLDTETTGLSTADGHRIIEIGCVELINRRLTGNNFHSYFNPQRDIDKEAQAVHGISAEFLADKPLFRESAQNIVDYLMGAELIIHNAPFDIGFLDYELRLLGKHYQPIINYCQVIDSLLLARQKHPGQPNSLDALCKRYQIDNSDRTYHGALLDAKLLAEVYLAMTGGQTTLFIEAVEQASQPAAVAAALQLSADRPNLPVIAANAEELVQHEQHLKTIDKASKGHCLWLKEEVER